MPTPTLKEFIKNRILWRVYFIWFLRRMLPIVLLQIAALVVLVKIFARNVFVSKVLENVVAASGFGYGEVFKFLLAAFINAHFAVQAVIVISLGISALIIRDIVRALLTYINTFRERVSAR